MFTHPLLLLILLLVDTLKAHRQSVSFPPSCQSIAIADCHPLSDNSPALVADVCVVELKAPAQQVTQISACWGFPLAVYFALNQ